MAETDRRIITLPYGEGLERSKGVMVINPTTFDDLRNVFNFDGKAQVRQGLGLTSVLQDDQPVDLDVTVMLEPLRSLSASMGVGYNTAGGSNREVWLNRMLVDGTSPTAVGLLGVLDGGVTFVPPIIIGADSDNKFFIAHDEPNPSSRLVTQVYDPEDFPQLSSLQADLDGNGQSDVFFRGVVRHLSYVFGWGYGSAEDPIRGDVVRVSKSGNSRDFEDFAFFEAGQQGETVMVCRSAGPTLMVFKETETYEIFGYSPDTFGIRLADSLFGCVGSRLAVSIAGTVFFWSTQGPRLTSGGPSVDIAVPLDIGGPDPATLVAESEPQDAFAAYDPRTRVVQFVWGQRVYALSIRDPNRPRWSYYELGERAQCSGLFFSTQSQAGGGGPPIGAPTTLIFDEETRGTLTLTGNANNNETVLVNNKTYTFQTVLTDVDGNVFIGATPGDTVLNLIGAITLTGGPGTQYALSMTINSDMTAGLGPTANDLVASGRLGEGFAGNGKPLEETMLAGSWNSPVSIDGIGQTSTFVEMFISNIDQIGAEQIEIHVSDDGGANYTFTGKVPANGLAPPERQKLKVTLESQQSGKAIQPITDYKFSLRYILGGQFSPGYESVDPDVWPAASQGSTTTTADPIVLRTRIGDETGRGLWEQLNDDDNRINVDTEIPPGHELLDIEVFLTVREAGPATSPDGAALVLDPTPPLRGAFVPGVTGPFLRTIYNSASPEYPLRFQDSYGKDDPIPAPQNEKINDYQMRFRKGANFSTVSNSLPCYGGPDAQTGDAISGAAIISVFGTNLLTLFWQNTDTPDGTAESGGLRVCPAPNASGLPPRQHSTTCLLRNVTFGTPWTKEFTALSNTTSVTSRAVTNTPMIAGDVIRVAIRHRVTCFGGFLDRNRYDSEYAINEGDIRFVEFTVTFGA